MTSATTVPAPPASRASRSSGAPWPDARRLAAAVPPLGAVRLPLARAVGRVLAEDVTALADLPSADNSAMDGWAVAGPPPWRVVADLAPGGPPGRPLARGECARIATGTAIPPGTDAVVPIEHSTADAAGVRPNDQGRPRRTHIRRAGEQARAGDLLVPPGTPVSPPVVGLAAAAGHDTLLVVPAARVGVLVLGDELADAGVPVAGMVRDALGPQLPAWLAALGCAAPEVTRLPDRQDVLDDTLAASDADVIVTTGGTGPGPRDHVRAAVLRAGGRILVDGVRVKPGHPMLLVAFPDGRRLVGLPGNALAACVALVTLLEPLLASLHARPPAAAQTRTLGSDEPGRPGDGHRLLPVRHDSAESVIPLPSCGAAMLRGLAGASGLVVVPPGGAQRGDQVEYLSLPW